MSATNGGQPVSMDAAFAGGAPAGVWTLRITDGSMLDLGTITSARLKVATVAVPTTVADAVTAAYVTPLTVAAPGLLANDQDNLGGPMTAALITPPAHGHASVSPSGAFTYTPQVGFTGTDTFTYRATNTDGPGNVATVSVLVPVPTTVQAPTGFRASSVAGTLVTRRWTAPFGPVATDYIVEGGVAPGQVLAAVATGGPLPILTFQAPPRRLLPTRACRGGWPAERAVERDPTGRHHPRRAVCARGLHRRGQRRHAGPVVAEYLAAGEPTATQLVVTGSAVDTTSLPLTETFAFAGVPAGGYTFRVRAVNGAGVSAESNPVTLTFRTGCGAAPGPPENFLAYAVGNVVHLVWDPPASDAAAATSYVITVGGSFAASVPFAGRTLSTPAPPGAYSFTVASVNACGTGVATPAQTVFVP